jgi:hypothetical protein
MFSAVERAAEAVDFGPEPHDFRLTFERGSDAVPASEPEVCGLNSESGDHALHRPDVAD